MCVCYYRETAEQREEERLLEKREKGVASRQQREEEILDWVSRKTELIEV